MSTSISNKPAQAGRFRVLVVDDNPAIHADFRKILLPRADSLNGAAEMESILFENATRKPESMPFELESAFQGQDACELLQESVSEERPFALAFVDVRMPPGWDGVEVVLRLWEIYPHLQIVICTAYSDYSWAELREKVGCPDSLVILKKPFENVEVQQLAHALTRKWELNLQAAVQLHELEEMVIQRTVELKQANENLTRSEERFSKAFNTSPIAMGIASLKECRFVDVNAHMTLLTGWTRAEMVGRSCSELSLWNKPDTADELVAALWNGDNIRDREAELRDRSGNIHQVLVSVSLMEIASQPHALLVLQDVTERNLLERQFRQAQKMEAVGQLAAGVAHDFNNILTVIQGHAGLICNRLHTENLPIESAEKITDAASRAAALIRQLLMFSRKQITPFRALDLNECIANTLAMVGRLVGEHIRIDFNPGQNLPSVHGDPTMIEQVFLNLAVNARDAMPNGGVITIATEAKNILREPTPMDPEKREGQFIRCSFSDTGCGMDTAILTRIFEPFFTTKGAGKGTGLGLSTVFGIVRQHNGWIEVNSEPNRGTEFVLHLPVGQKPAETTRTAGENSTSLLRGHETILVAEDEDALREMVSLVLTAQGYNVLIAASGVEALQLYEQANRPVDLLLTDMVMPGGLMGHELAERLRNSNSRLKVVFTSGYSPDEANTQIVLLKERNFLPKPYSIGELARFVRQCLDESAGQN